MIYADFKSILLAEYNVRAKYTNKIRANIKNMLLCSYGYKHTLQKHMVRKLKAFYY